MDAINSKLSSTQYDYNKIEVTNKVSEGVQGSVDIIENGKPNDALKKKEEQSTSIVNKQPDGNNGISKLLKDNTKLEIEYNKDINRYSVSIIDKDSQKVIRELPSEEIVKFLERIADVTGNSVDKKL